MPPEITREKLNFSMTRKVKWRYLSKKFDRFRREYIVWLDRNNSEPTGQVERHFSAPLTIPDEFLTFPNDKPWRVDLDLLAYARYLKASLQEWEVRYEEIRGSLAKNVPDEKALKLAGEKPQDWRLVVLADRGDAWCLGFQAERTPAVVSIIGPAPTLAEIRRLAKLGPKDLRLDPELEALLEMGPKASAQFPDERESDEDSDLQERALRGVDPQELDPNGALARRMNMNAALDLIDQDEDEPLLTGDLDLDTGPDLQFDDDTTDLAEALEEHFDPAALGGKKTDPKKNRTKSGKE